MGIVTGVRVDDVAAQVEVQSGPHRLVSLVTREAVEELGLEGVLTSDAVAPWCATTATASPPKPSATAKATDGK